MPVFQYNIFLYGLVLIPLMILLFLLALRRKKKIIKKIGDEGIVKQLISHYSAASFLQKFILMTLAMGLLILAFANLRTPAGANGGKRNGLDVMIAVDVSKSMLAEDIKPSRLERAKQLLSKLID